MSTPTNQSFSLSTLLVPSKVVEVELTGHPSVKVNLAFISREELTKIRKKATKVKFNNRTRQPDETLDEDLFLRLYSDATIKGWSGLTLEVLEKLTLVDITGADKKSELIFSPEEAYLLMKNSAEFDAFVSDTINDLTTFQKTSSKK